MAAELTRVANQVLMGYAQNNGQEVPWHRQGKGYDRPITVDDMHQTCRTDIPVTVESLYFKGPDGGDILLPDRRVVVWDGRVLGTAGPNTTPIQNFDFFEQARAWERPIETFGLLRNGAVPWFQLNLSLEAEVRPGDSVKSFYMFTSSHDGSLSMLGYLCNTRVVCNNTLLVSLSEGINKVRRKHTGAVVNKASQINMIMKALVETRDSELDKYRYLASINVKDCKVIDEFCRRVSNTKKAEGKRGALEVDIEARFRNGIGNVGESFWDLLNAWTEKVTHDTGNSLKGETDGERAVRRLDNAWFGPGAASNTRALEVAMDMARAA